MKETIKKENVVNNNLINETIIYIESTNKTTIDMLRWENEKEELDWDYIKFLEWKIDDTEEIIEQLKTTYKLENMNETIKNGGLINNDNQPQVSKELKSNKIQFEDGFRLRDFMDVMDEVDSFLLKKGRDSNLPDEFYQVICSLTMLLDKENLLEREEYFSWVNRRSDRLSKLRNWVDERTKELQLQIDDFKKNELIDYVIEIDESYEEHIENLMDNDLIDIIIEHEQTIN